MGCPFKAIADNTRREILVYLSKGDTVAGEIANKFNISNLQFPITSKFLRKLILLMKRRSSRIEFIL